MTQQHALMGGKLYLYMRPRSSNWQCRAYIGGRDWRRSTGEDSLSHAKDIAEDWFFELRGKKRAGLLDADTPPVTSRGSAEGPRKAKTNEMSFSEAGELFFKEYQAINGMNVSAKYIETMRLRFNTHLEPFFGKWAVTDINQGTVQNYRVHRQTSHRNHYTGQISRPSRSTLKQEVVVVRHVLSTAHMHGKLPSMPLIVEPFTRSPKVDHLAWFSPEDYRKLYKETWRRTQSPPRERDRNSYKELHDFVIFMANTGLRPSEAKKLRFQDINIISDKATNERILDIHVVDGKRGVGRCLSMPGAVRPFQHLFKRANFEKKARVFTKIPRTLLNAVLDHLGLKRDYQGKPRTAGSLRHSYFCYRVLAGADKEELAKNGRTSVEMLDKYYLPHLKGYVDTAKINMKQTRNWGVELH